MNSFEALTTVQASGDIRIAGLPFAPGTEVEVSISPKRKSAREFSDAWDDVCRELRTLPNAASISDEEIRSEIDEYRAGR
jgi:hypothetical protein